MLRIFVKPKVIINANINRRVYLAFLSSCVWRYYYLSIELMTEWTFYLILSLLCLPIPPPNWNSTVCIKFLVCYLKIFYNLLLPNLIINYCFRNSVSILYEHFFCYKFCCYKSFLLINYFSVCKANTLMGSPTSVCMNCGKTLPTQ